MDAFNKSYIDFLEKDLPVILIMLCSVCFVIKLLVFTVMQK